LWLSQRNRWELRPSGPLRSEQWKLLADVSGEPIGPIFRGRESKRKGPTGCTETSLRSCHCSLRKNA
jgi:hypothetical protein